MVNVRAMRSHVSLFVAAVAAAVLMIATASPSAAQQVPDTLFDTRITHPAWERGKGPRLLLDEAHRNFHTLDGRYRPFADLARNDGFRVAANRQPFTREGLAAADLLVIANATGADDMGSREGESPAFTADEGAAMRAWVEGGGALLLIADHSPFGAATSGLARALGVDLRNSYAGDPLYGESGNPTSVIYTAGRGLDTTHAIVRGRSAAERVTRVKTFTGESVAGPRGSAMVLALSDSAYDDAISITETHLLQGPMPPERRSSARGRAQGVAFELGKGRVVVLGEAAMLSAQLAGPGGRHRMGMNQPGNDNRQFATNVLRWLGRRL